MTAEHTSKCDVEEILAKSFACFICICADLWHQSHCLSYTPSLFGCSGTNEHNVSYTFLNKEAIYP